MEFKTTGPRAPFATLLLGHGSGAPMDSPFLEDVSAGLAERGLGVARFEFAFMATRRLDGRRRPPPRADKLIPEFCQAVDRLQGKAPLVIAGKSLGGRVASMVAGELFGDGRIAGCIALGYPFHPPGRPDRLRTAHLVGLACPLLICQGERDPFGPRNEVAGYDFGQATIRFHWVGDGDHGFEPRKRSGRTLGQNLDGACQAIASFVDEIVHREKAI